MQCAFCALWIFICVAILSHFFQVRVYEAAATVILCIGIFIRILFGIYHLICVHTTSKIKMAEAIQKQRFEELLFFVYRIKIPHVHKHLRIVMVIIFMREQLK